jgi:hypothetical protein
MAFHREIDFFRGSFAPSPFLSSRSFSRSALISQELLCDEKVENDRENVSEKSGHKVGNSG